jgi:hypothetical protein
MANLYPGVHFLDETVYNQSTNICGFDTIYWFLDSSKGDTQTCISIDSLDTFITTFNPSPALLGFAKTFFYQIRSVVKLNCVRVKPTLNNLVSSADWIRDAYEVLDYHQHEPGFVIFPQVQLITSALDRNLIIERFDNLVNDQKFLGHCLTDITPSLKWYRSLIGSNATKALYSTIDTNTEAINYADGLRALNIGKNGNSSIYWNHPSFVDLSNTSQIIPSLWSVVVAPIAIQRMQNDGIASPPAGFKMMPRYVESLDFMPNSTTHKFLNDSNINIAIRHLKYGICIMGAKTLNKIKNEFLWINSSISMQVLKRSVQSALEDLVFSNNASPGDVDSAIRIQCSQVAQELWLNKSLYGTTFSDSFLVQTSSNLLEQQQGIYTVSIYAKPSVTLEQILLRVVRVGISSQVTIGTPTTDSTDSTAPKT